MGKNGMSGYTKFIEQKTKPHESFGFDPVWSPDFLFDFQTELVEWAIRLGRAAIFADCGLGKSPMQLVWASNVVQQTGGRVLILTPLTVVRLPEPSAEPQSMACFNFNAIDCGSADGSGSRQIWDCGI